MRGVENPAHSLVVCGKSGYPPSGLTSAAKAEVKTAITAALKRCASQNLPAKACQPKPAT